MLVKLDEKHLTSIYGEGNMDNVEWDIWEPAEEEGLEEVEEPESFQPISGMNVTTPMQNF